MKTEDIKKMGLAYLSVIEAASKKEDNSNDKSDDGDGMDKVQPKAVKKKFDDRKDKDIDNDGDTDSSDEFLHKKRKAISKSIDKEESKKTRTEGQRGFIMAAKAAKANGDETFVFAGKKYNCEDALTSKREAVEYAFMDEDEFDALIENATPEQLDEIIGTLKKIGGAAVSGVKKVANRFSTSGRADAADNKLAKAKKKVADKDRLSKAKAGLAALKKKPTSEDEDHSDDQDDAEVKDADPKKKKNPFMKEEDEADAGPAKDKDQVCEECGKVHEGDCDPADVEAFKSKKEAINAPILKNSKKKKKLKADDEDPADADSVEADDDEEKPTVAKEEATIEKTYAGVQNGMRQAMMRMWEDAQHTKGATKPEGINDKNSKSADKMVKDHKPEVQGDVKKVADEAAAKIAGSAKASPKNKGDNAAGDKTIINKPSEK